MMVDKYIQHEPYYLVKYEYTWYEVLHTSRKISLRSLPGRDIASMSTDRQPDGSERHVWWLCL